MNILLLTTHLNVGGISSYLLSLGGSLKKKGHRIFIASSGGELLPRFINEGIEYIHIPIKTKAEISPKILISFFILNKYIKEENIDIIHAHTRVTQVLASFLRNSTGKPFVSTCHGFFKNRFTRRLFPCWGNRVIAISEEVKRHLIVDLGVAEEKIRLVYNAVDTDRFHPVTSHAHLAAKEKFGLSGSSAVIGIVARLSDVKGHIYLIQAMQIVLKQFPLAQLLIIGEGNMQKELLNLSRKLGIEKSVSFIASVADTREVLAAMDIFVMPSLKEGLGLGLMEAMSSGLAVIGSGVGGIKSLIRNNENGLLVQPQDSRVLSRAIIELVSCPEKAAFFGSNARKFILEKFPLGQMFFLTERVYLECLNAKS